jgi:phage shock protein E
MIARCFFIFAVITIIKNRTMFELFKNLFSESIDYKSLMQKGALIIDVRSPVEFKSGSIRGSRNIPLDQLQNRISELKKSGKSIITVCRSGNRSAVAKSMLRSAGIEVYNGGAWTSLDKKIR